MKLSNKKVPVWYTGIYRPISSTDYIIVFVYAHICMCTYKLLNKITKFYRTTRSIKSIPLDGIPFCTSEFENFNNINMTTCEHLNYGHKTTSVDIYSKALRFCYIILNVNQHLGESLASDRW
jgi:hypothetical protein